ncbi:MAG: ABC transporter permease [Geobacteraceae bacterium]|nr:ABC transporter permease [Geobacteraceae bacterium]
MLSVARVTLKGVFRDRVFQGIFMAALLFLFIPSVASLSMRQVTELSISLSLSLISFILLLLAVFLGGASLWKDMERRYSFSVLALPIKRSDYLLGKFCGVALFLLLTVLLLWAVTSLVVFFASGIYPSPRPVAWHYLFLAVFYDSLKYILLVAVAFLFSTVSTSFFLPIFGTIAIFLVGSATQEAYDFIHTPLAKDIPAVVKGAATGLYYILPNFTAFDLKLNAIYGVQVSGQGLLLTFGYFLVYTAIVLFLATVVFSRRELK